MSHVRIFWNEAVDELLKLNEEELVQTLLGMIANEEP